MIVNLKKKNKKIYRNESKTFETFENGFVNFRWYDFCNEPGHFTTNEESKKKSNYINLENVTLGSCWD